MSNRAFGGFVNTGKIVLVEIPEAAAGVVFWVAILRWLYQLVSNRRWLLAGLVLVIIVISGYGVYRLAVRESKRVRKRIVQQRLSYPMSPVDGQSLTDTLLAAIPSSNLLHSSIAAVEDAAADFASDAYVGDYYLYIKAGPGKALLVIQAVIISAVRQQTAHYYLPGNSWSDSEPRASQDTPIRDRYIHRVHGWRNAFLLATENAASELAKATRAEWQICYLSETSLRMILHLYAKNHHWKQTYELAGGFLRHDGHEVGTVSG